MANWTDAAAMVRQAESSRARQVGPAQAAREGAARAHDMYPCAACGELYLERELTATGACKWCICNGPPSAVLCATCEEPTVLLHTDRHGREVCGSCLDIGEAICAYAHEERLAVIRARAVLAREGIAGYGL